MKEVFKNLLRENPLINTIIEDVTEIEKLATSMLPMSVEEALRLAVKELEDASVYVGIPEEKAGRTYKSASGKKKSKLSISPMNNATLLYIHTHGSPKMNIPPRPVIEPAIEDEINSMKINKELLTAITKKLDGNKEGFFAGLERAGMYAQNACKDWFTNPKNNWPPNVPSVQKSKMKKGATEPRPLIDTGQLRNSIVYVLKKTKYD